MRPRKSIPDLDKIVEQLAEERKSESRPIELVSTQVSTMSVAAAMLFVFCQVETEFSGPLAERAGFSRQEMQTTQT